MKAIIITRYGSPDVLKLTEIEKPTAKDNEVLLKVKSASVTAADTMMRKGKPLYGRLFIGLKKPKYPIIGTGFSGVIEKIGPAVTSFKVGDEVYGESIFGAGTNAEYLCVPEDGMLAPKPEYLTHEEVASVCDGPLTSWNFLKEIAKVKKGQKVLVYGASGSLGTAAVQLANHLGAEVTGVCGTSNMEMVQSLGAAYIIDYTQTDFTKTEKRYDVIFDTVGKTSFSKSKKVLVNKGSYLSPVLGTPLLFQVLWTSIFGTKKALFSATGLKTEKELRKLFDELNELLESRQLKMLIDKRFSLEQVPDAHRYVDTGRKKGNVVVQIR
ncbi:NAD(P)-dependent alcohol dehydrogenase [uncultured Kriegella sp.]|uniref:NAD(P)-dependent alcohol dehydrogenase n=1 Tax=uncultured Kriegella sp. TaxID=1798910 RepID=UPI0030DCA08F|tara:strand:- start:38443 stop:39417 length:975 start_codon:yes stop_codon:yes gene_type:complete